MTSSVPAYYVLILAVLASEESLMLAMFAQAWLGIQPAGCTFPVIALPILP